MQLILASTSPYRKMLLDRLQLPFIQIAPCFEEINSDNNPSQLSAAELVIYNTIGKADAVLDLYPHAQVIASDQLAVCGNTILGKPGTAERACQQLAMLSGKKVTFLTGLALYSSREKRSDIIDYHVWFRELSDNEIRNYVERENPIDCAGSFKSEGLGISLFTQLEGDDPTALIGLPLIRLCEWLKPLQSPV